MGRARTVTKFHNWICITLDQLYLMLQFDRVLWELCDVFERFEEALNKGEIGEKDVRTSTMVVLSLVLGIPRNRIVRMLVESGLYSESYAEKAVRRHLEILARQLEEFTPYGMRAKRKRAGKGRWGRREVEKKAGRPPLVYSIERSYSLITMKIDERLGRLMALASVLSGSFPRLLKICVRMWFKLGILDDMVRCLNELLGERNLQLLDLKLEDGDVEKIIVKIEEWIDECFDSLVGPIREDASKLLIGKGGADRGKISPAISHGYVVAYHGGRPCYLGPLWDFWLSNLPETDLMEVIEAAFGRLLAAIKSVRDGSDRERRLRILEGKVEAMLHDVRKSLRPPPSF